MSRKPLVFALSALLCLVFTLDAFADARCKTRKKCRWYAKQYVATATVGCWFPAVAFTLCHQRAGSCGAASAHCGWKSCLPGGATASATNNYGSCSVSAYRSGLGRYGEETNDPQPGSENGEGAHKGVIRTEYLDNGGAAIYFDEMTLSSTLDESFSRVDLIAYVESQESLDNDSEDFLPDRVLHHSYIHLQNGVVSQKGFDEIAALYRGADDVTELDLSGFSLILPKFEGTDDELDRVSIDVIVDGGQPAVSSNR